MSLIMYNIHCHVMVTLEAHSISTCKETQLVTRRNYSIKTYYNIIVHVLLLTDIK